MENQLTSSSPIEEPRVDGSKMVQRLAQRIADLTVENAMLSVQLDEEKQRRIADAEASIKPEPTP